MAGSWKHMNYSQLKLGKGKEEGGATRKHIKKMKLFVPERPRRVAVGAA